jgi:hypothetical protein
MMGNRNMEARRYAADVPAGVTGAAGSCSPQERRDKREQSRVSLRPCAPRLLFLCSTGSLSRGSTRRPTRAQPLHGANRHGGNHLQRHGSRPSDQPFDQIECQVRPKIPHDPASFVAGAPPGSAGHKKKMKKPRPSPAGPQKKSLYAIVSAREISLVHPLKVD